MDNYKDKLQTLIDASSLDDNQRMLWKLFLTVSHREENEAVFEAANESNENLTLLTKHLRDKIWDMKEENPKKWKNIIKEEEKYAGIL